MGNKVINNTIAFTIFSALFIFVMALAALAETYYLIAIPFIALFFYYGWNKPAAVFYLLIFVLPWSVEYNFSSTLGTDLPDEPLMLIVSLLVIVHLLYRKPFKNNGWGHPLVLLLFIQTGWIIISVFFSTYPVISLKYFLSKSWYLLAFFFAGLLFLKNKQTISRAALVLIISILAVCFLIMVRHATGDFLFININEAAAPFFRNHVTYSAMLVCSVPVLLAIKNLSKNNILNRVFLLVICFVLAALVFTFSRGAWLALFTGLAGGWLIKKKWLLQTFLAIVFLTGVVFAWLRTNDHYLQFAPDYKTTIFHTNFKEHLSATYKLKDVSTAERFYRWIAGVRMVDEKPLTGFGPATFNKNYHPYGLPVFKTWVSSNNEGSTVHNYFLLVAIEQGLPGLMILLVLLSCIFYYVQRVYHQTRDEFYKQVMVAVGSIIVMIVTVNFLSDLIETDKVGSLFFICISLVVTIDFLTKKENLPTAKLL